MKNLTRTIMIILLLLSIASPTLATPSVFVELSHGESYATHGDSIDNDFNFPFHNMWLVYMKLESPDVVNGPYIEFTTDSNFVDINPWPTSINSPSVFVWDKPEDSLDSNQPETRAYLTEYVDLDKPGFVASRTVNTPILSSNSITQTVDFTLEFKDALPVDVNLIRVQLAGVGSEMVTELVTSQSSDSGWMLEPDSNGTWVMIPQGISIGTEYNFQVQVQCTKRPDYEGVTIYHKPEVSVMIADWQQLSSGTGTSTTLTHSQGETATFELNESVNWDRNVASNRKSVLFKTVSVPVDSNGLDVDKVELSYGERYDVNNASLGYHVGIEVECKNVIFADMNTPTGRTWPLTLVFISYPSRRIRPELWLDYLTREQLTDLGIVDGIYQVIFKDHLGASLTTTSSSLTLDTPTQIPHITSPAPGAENVGPRTTIRWNSVSDPNVDEIRVFLRSYRMAWKSKLWPWTSYTYDLPPRSAIMCDLFFCDNKFAGTSEGVSWNTVKSNIQRIYFSTGALPGDFDIDDEVNFDDLDFLTSHWLDTGCNDSSGDESDWCYGSDISMDGNVNFCDFSILADYWLYD